MTTSSLQKLEDNVQAMIGKTYLINAVAHKILSYRIESNKLQIVSDKKWFPAVDVQHSNKLLETFLETEAEPEVLPATPQQPVVLQSAANLQSILLDNIKRVQESKDYIPQASEIGNQIKTLIDLAKTEIDFYRLQNRR